MMDIIYQLGRATAAEVHTNGWRILPSYSAVRAKLRVLEDKGHIRHETQAARYIYSTRGRICATAPKNPRCAISSPRFSTTRLEQAMTALLALKPGKFSRPRNSTIFPNKSSKGQKREGGKS